MTRPFYAAMVAVLTLSAGCSTIPKTAAIQTTAVGGGFIATGAVTSTLGAIGGGAGLVATSQIGGSVGNDARINVIIATAVTVGVGLAEIVVGTMLLQRGGEAIDEADRLERDADLSIQRKVRELTRPRQKPVRTPTKTPTWGQAPEDEESPEDTPPR